MRTVLEHPYFGNIKNSLVENVPITKCKTMSSTLTEPHNCISNISKSGKTKNTKVSRNIVPNKNLSSSIDNYKPYNKGIVQSFPNGASYDDENTENGVFRHCTNSSIIIIESQLSKKICGVQDEDTYKAWDSSFKTKKIGFIRNKVRQIEKQK